jgi:hypothetical protein
MYVFHQVLLDYERHITNADAGELSVPIASKSEPKLLKPPKLPKSEPKHVDNKVNFKQTCGTVFFNIDHNFMIPLVYCLVVIFLIDHVKLVGVLKTSVYNVSRCAQKCLWCFFFDKVRNSHERKE